jgi:hypothetical protein
MASVLRVPADYATIRDENIARYGWDTAVLDLLGQLYSERTHFIFELIQNAEDAGATELAFELFDDRLEVRHDGRPFTEADVRGVCGVGQSAKSGDLTKIGQFGIGFKSVYAYTSTPRVHSGDEHFRIDVYVRPSAVDPPGEDGAGGGRTLFVFPFDHGTVTAAVAVQEISVALNTIEPGTLLFLTSIRRLSVRGAGVTSSVIERTTRHRTATSRHVTLSTGRGRHREEWIVWHRAVPGLGQPAPATRGVRAAESAYEAGGAREAGNPGEAESAYEARGAQETGAGRGPGTGLRVEIAFRAATVRGQSRIAGTTPSPLTVFFPTEKETFLGFLIQGPYRTTPARDNVPGHDPSNQALVRETAALLAGVLRELRAGGLLTVEVLTALPLEAGHFPPGSMFRPFFETVRDILAHEQVIPAAGGYQRADDVRLASDSELHELLSPDQLGALLGAAHPLFFADPVITEHLTPVLWHYLRAETGLAVITPEDVVTGATSEFLAAQPDEWITRLYAFLYLFASLWKAPRFPGEEPGPARTRPVIRLEDGRQVAPFDADDHPVVYLPGAGGSGLPTVRRAIAAAPGAQPFLDALNLAEPDVVAEVLEIVLPRYGRLDIAALDPAQHDADLECIARALDEAAPGRRERLLDWVDRTAFLIGENAATGDQRLMPPPSLYQRAKDLDIYFDGNPDAWFAGDAYGPWLAQLRAMGVRDSVEVRARPAGPLGYVVLVDEFARQERGIDGFDPAAEIDGLDFALSHPSPARSEYVWNVVLGPNRGLVAGVVEQAVRPSYADSSLATVPSAIGAAAARAAWLPGLDGAFRRPADLSLDDLPPTYARDETLAHGLGMAQPVVAEAASQLGVPAAVLRGLGAHPDLVALVERELRARDAGGQAG